MSLILYFLCMSIFGQCHADDPEGHLMPLGYNSKFLELPLLSEFPTPTTFYENHIKASKPFVVKAAVIEQNFPPLTKWTDEFFRTNFGDAFVPIDLLRKNMSVSFADFLRRYRQENLQLKTRVEDIADSLLDDLRVPPSIVCGGLQNLLDTASLWLSSGGPSFKSYLQKNYYDDILCVVDGNNDVTLISKALKDDVEADGFDKFTSYSLVDVNSVNMYHFPGQRDLPMYRGHLSKGDCLYMPYKWYIHQQMNSPERSLAVSFSSIHTRWFNDSDCGKTKLSVELEPLLKYGLIKPNMKLLMEVFHDMDELDEIRRPDIFSRIWGDTDVKEKMFNVLDKNGNSALSWDEIFSPDAGKVVDEFKELFDANLDGEPWEATTPIKADHDEF